VTLLAPGAVAASLAVCTHCQADGILRASLVVSALWLVLMQVHTAAVFATCAIPAGVDVGALESAAAAGGSAAAKGAAKAVARSSTILLAKNLPYTVT
jgi:hypothetical protein